MSIARPTSLSSWFKGVSGVLGGMKGKDRTGGEGGSVVTMFARIYKERGVWAIVKEQSEGALDVLGLVFTHLGFMSR